MNRISEQTAAWDFLRQLPAEYAGFTLYRQPEQRGNQYHIFTYDNPGIRRRFTALYDRSTKDLMALVTIGLSEYYDVGFIADELISFENALSGRLFRALDNLADPASENYESIFRSKQILQWPYGSELPVEAAGFELFISPQKPVKLINGSYIIIDYSDFKAASNLTVYYNIYRDEFFGEVRVGHAPRMISQFDAKELPELADKLKIGLLPSLSALRAEMTV